MSTATITPPFETRYPRLARIATWPLICIVVSAIFLATVYTLGNFGEHPSPTNAAGTPSVALSAVANPGTFAK
jgi:hypothetical protein